MRRFLPMLVTAGALAVLVFAGGASTDTGSVPGASLEVTAGAP
jgi:hypothetical protein